MEKQVAVEMKNISKHFGSVLANKNVNLDVYRGEILAILGENGCGKSSLIKVILQKDFYGGSGSKDGEADDLTKLNLMESGTLRTASGLVISYINQDTSFLCGSIKDFCKERNLDESLFCAILRQLDMDRVQFVKNMEDFSEGQKKKILIAASLLTSAHLYIWDEPLNYIDVFSRMQIEKLILTYQPTMLIVEHDVRFREQIATKVIEM